jgi:hypothetical protein
MKLTLIGISEAADADGNLRLRLLDNDGEEHHALIPVALSTELIMRFQQATIEGAKAGTFYPRIPELIVRDANVAHQPQASELMASIDEMGWVVLRCSDELLRHLKMLIDRVLTFRTQPTKTQ